LGFVLDYFKHSGLSVTLQVFPNIMSKCLSSTSFWVVAVKVPTGGVVLDIATNLVERCFCSDDVFKIIALPDFFTGRVSHDVDLSGADGFE
jgi:hypothetical protein